MAAADRRPGYDAIIFGTPARIGDAASQMRDFPGRSGGLRAKGALTGHCRMRVIHALSAHPREASRGWALRITLRCPVVYT